MCAQLILSIFDRYGCWGVCFTYGGWFGITGLIAAGNTYSNCPCIRKACDYLLSKELASGGWGESYLSCPNKVLISILCGISFLYSSSVPHDVCS